jgi:hypothetical protein
MMVMVVPPIAMEGHVVVMAPPPAAPIVTNVVNVVETLSIAPTSGPIAMVAFT